MCGTRESRPTALSYHAAYSRGSGRSRRGRWATSDSLALAPKPGLKAFRQRTAHRLLGWGDVEANNIGGFGRKVRVIALTPGLANREVDFMAAQEPPDILDVNLAQCTGQQGPRPACEPLPARFVPPPPHPLVGPLRITQF